MGPGAGVADFCATATAGGNTIPIKVKMNNHLRMMRSLPAAFEWNRIHDSAETRLRGHAFLNLAERSLVVVVWCVSVPLDPRNKAPSLSVANMNVIDPELDAIAIASVQQWRFTPCKKDGKTVAYRMQLKVDYRLR